MTYMALCGIANQSHMPALLSHRVKNLNHNKFSLQDLTLLVTGVAGR